MSYTLLSGLLRSIVRYFNSCLLAFAYILSLALSVSPFFFKVKLGRTEYPNGIKQREIATIAENGAEYGPEHEYSVMKRGA